MTGPVVDFGKRRAPPPKEPATNGAAERDGTPYTEHKRAERAATPPTLWAPDLAKAVEPIVFVAKGLTVAPGRPSVLAGEGGARKGWFAMDLQVCGAASIALLGRFVIADVLRSVYFDYEQTQRVSRERFQLLSKGHGIELASLGDRLGYRWKPIPSWAPKTDADRQRVLDELCWHTQGLQLAIVDSVRACSPGVDENSVFASGPLDIATAVSEKTGVAFLFLDHAGKPPQDVSNSGRTRKHTQRGHSSKLDAGQTLFVFSVAAKGEPTLVTCERAQVVSESDRPDDFRFTLASANGGLQLQEVISPDRGGSTPDAELSKLCRKFTTALGPNPGSSLAEIAKRMGVRLDSARAARDTLHRLGRIENRGTQGAPEWWLTTSAGVTDDE